MKLDSYWLDTAPPLVSACEGPVEGQADVVVIGGGFTGLSAAQALGKRGASVTVLDAGRIGGGASGRNGGQVNTGVAQDFVALVAQLGV
ncbi:MAG: FAD-dependent oxidoreductase, partial [Paraburkholderia nemoris]